MSKAHTQKTAALFCRPKDVGEMALLLEALLSPAEIDSLANRIEILKKLKAEIPQSKIAEDVGVGIATVTRGSKVVQNPKFASLLSWWG